MNLSKELAEVNENLQSAKKKINTYILGTFSKVYKARDLLVDKYMPMEQKDKLSSTLDGADANFVAVKLIFDISAPLRVANEIHFLTLLR